MWYEGKEVGAMRENGLERTCFKWDGLKGSEELTLSLI